MDSQKIEDMHHLIRIIDIKIWVSRIINDNPHGIFFNSFQKLHVWQLVFEVFSNKGFAALLGAHEHGVFDESAIVEALLEI